jgi:hypothetical protein
MANPINIGGQIANRVFKDKSEHPADYAGMDIKDIIIFGGYKLLTLEEQEHLLKLLNRSVQKTKEYIRAEKAREAAQKAQEGLI